MWSLLKEFFKFSKQEKKWWLVPLILVLLLLGALPTWGHSRSWGYFPSGGLGLILVIIIVLVLLGKI